MDIDSWEFGIAFEVQRIGFAIAENFDLIDRLAIRDEKLRFGSCHPTSLRLQFLCQDALPTYATDPRSYLSLN
jgi:hypothetical protein